MLAVMTAKWVGDALSPPLYDEIAQLKSIPLLEFHTPLHTYMKDITTVMEKEVVCIRDTEQLDRVVDIIEQTRHHGFPVIKEESEDRPRTYVGYITRKQLLLMLEQQLYFLKTDEHRPGNLSWG